MATLGNTTVPDTQTSGNVDRVNLNQYTVSGGDFSITTLHTRVSDIVSSGALFRLAVYASDGPSGNAGSLLCYTANLATTGGSFADVSGNPNTPTTLTNGVAYWIGLHFGSNNVALGQVSAASVSRLIQTGATFASGAPNPYTTTPGTGSSPQFCVWLVGAPPVVVPVANFTGTPLSGTGPLSVVFTDASTNTPTSWAWTFGDGGTSTAQNPSHSYVTAGTFTVALTATNSAGSNTLTRTGYVVVADQPRPIRINTSQGWADIGDASSFVSGSGAPTVAVGATGAIYLNTATGLLYGPKAGGVWPGSPITVPSGGTTYRVGSGAPASGLGAVGDLYEDLLTADLYQKQNYTGAPLLRASATNLTEASNSTSHTCPVPAGVVVGDLLILLVAQYVYDGATVTPPSGWTSRGNHADGSATSGAGMAVFTRVADGTEGSSVSFTTSASGAATSAILAYIFASVDAVADFGSSQSTATPTVPSVTSTTANDAIVGICLSAGSLGGAPSGTPASGWTEKLDAQNAGIGSLLYVMDKAQAVAGASGTAVPTFASGRWWTWALAVKSSGSTPAWIKIEDRSVATDTIWDAKGDLAVATGADVAAKLVVGSNNQVLTADSTQTTGVKWAAPAAPTGGAVKLFDSLLAVDTVTIDTGASGIAGGYAALEVFLYGRTDEGAQGTECYFQLNNDTGANYDWQRVSGSAATVTGSNTNADSGWDAFVAGASSGANSFGMVHLLIPNYDGTVGFKAGRWTDGFADPAGSGRIAVKSGIWRNTAAITRLSVHAAFSGTVKFKAGSRLTIFGLG